jgi:hypothetical protein
MQVDPLHGKYPSLSPYAYCANNPIKLVDPDGQFIFSLVALATVAIVIAFDEYANTPTTETDTYEKTAGDYFLDGVEAASYTISMKGVSKLTKSGVSAKVGSSSSLQSSGPIKQTLSSLRNKAVKTAWKQEKKMVETRGKGTRKWSKSEKKQLIENGKVDGYEGHHINDVTNNPDLAGNPNNVKFVTKKEHLVEHGGNWKNPTSGELIKREK